MLPINQHIPIPHLIRLQIHDRLIRLLQPPLLNPRLNPLLHRQRKHLLNLMRRPDRAAPDLRPLHDQAEGVDGGQAILGRADLDELPVCAEQVEVFLQRHVGTGDGRDDQVERARVVGRPVFVVVCGDEVVCADLDVIF